MQLATLVQAAQAGDPAAYGHIVRRFQDMAFGGAYAWLGDAEEAQDAAQEAFIEAWQSLDKLHEPAAFPGWFGRIVRKRADRISRARPDTLAGDALEGLPSPWPDPLARYTAQEDRDRVRTALAALPADQRLPLTLYHLDGYRQKEIAAFLELPVSTVKKRIFDARQALKKRTAPPSGRPPKPGWPWPKVSAGRGTTCCSTSPASWKTPSPSLARSSTASTTPCRKWPSATSAPSTRPKTRPLDYDR